MTDTFYILFLFVLGTSIGSYVNVLGLRYSANDGFRRSNEGRSHCPHCRSSLKWFELIPIASFFIQLGKCRTCHKRISIQYPLIEIISGLLFIIIPLKLGMGIPAIVWMLAFLVLLTITIIDFRLRLIPDELTILVALLGAVLIGYYAFTDTFGLYGGGIQGSFLKEYALTFWFVGGNIFINFIAGIAVGTLSFGAIYLISRGRGMGFGDVKLAAALGFLLGWPDIALALVLAFLTGAVISLFALSIGKKRLKDALPFGPFIVLGVTLVFFFGYDILNGYFSIFGIF